MNAKDIIVKHSTRNPYEIARKENITVIFEKLGNVYGYYNTALGLKFIHINEDVPEYFQRYIVSHMLYPALNNKEGLQFITQKAAYKFSDLEISANKFAIDLLFDEQELEEFGSFVALMKKYGMTKEDIIDLSKRFERLFGHADIEYQTKFAIMNFINRKGIEHHD